MTVVMHYMSGKEDAQAAYEDQEGSVHCYECSQFGVAAAYTLASAFYSRG